MIQKQSQVKRRQARQESKIIESQTASHYSALSAICGFLWLVSVHKVGAQTLVKVLEPVQKTPRDAALRCDSVAGFTRFWSFGRGFAP
ncbi:MAG: hypothetical protein LBT00_16270, partial [Spirochaetaceae bacterium]|nr:hypothetical protein [Spirochaetaceae bacterium]